MGSLPCRAAGCWRVPLRQHGVERGPFTRSDNCFAIAKYSAIIRAVMSTYLRPDLDFDSLVPTFNAGEPFRNVVIDDFFAPEIAQQLADEFPAFDGPAWSVYHNPI